MPAGATARRSRGRHRRPATTARRCPIRTDGSGRVRIRLATGPSRTVRLAFAGDPLLLPAHRGTRIRTPASGWVHAHPTSVPAGGLVRFAGHLFGGHIPAAGKVVELQARVGSGWRTFATVRANRRGDFRHVHRFGADVRRPDLLGPPADPPGGRLPVRARHRPSDLHPCQVTIGTEHRALCADSVTPGGAIPTLVP